jgi:hypothetical protein
MLAMSAASLDEAIAALSLVSSQAELTMNFLPFFESFYSMFSYYFQRFNSLPFQIVSPIIWARVVKRRSQFGAALRTLATSNNTKSNNIPFDSLAPRYLHQISQKTAKSFGLPRATKSEASFGLPLFKGDGRGI